MMSLYSIHDTQAQCFNTPFWEMNNHTAQRAFRLAVNTPGTGFAENPADFNLFLLATFDAQTGKFEVIDPPIGVCTAIALVIPKENIDNG